MIHPYGIAEPSEAASYIDDVLNFHRALCWHRKHSASSLFPKILFGQPTRDSRG
jgi:hypothetical protein